MSLILATYQRNLEITEKKLVSSEQENIDLHIQLKQLIQNSSKLQHQIKEITSAANAPLPTITRPPAAVVAPEVSTERPASDAAVEKAQEQQQQYTAMYAMLSEQIKELKMQMMNKNSLVSSDSTASVEAPTAVLISSRKPTPPVTPARKLSVANAESQVEKSPSLESAGKVGVGTNTSRTTLDLRPPTPISIAEQFSQAENPHGFKSMAECLQHISALEANSHQALTTQLQKSQQRSMELSMRNTALEEELSSYQAYMRDVVPQYKKQLQYLKQQLKLRITAVAPAAKQAVLPDGIIDDADEKVLKLPLIK